MTNPYDPQSPAKPHYFGGRKHILEKVSERIEKARNQKQSGGVLIYGHRGVGKTSLVNKIISVAKPDGEERVLTVYRRLGRTTSDSEIYQLLTESVIEEIENAKNILGKVAGAAKKVSSANFLDFGVALKEDLAQKTPYHKWRHIIRNLKNIDFVLVAIDDADNLSTEALGELKTIVEEQNETPVLLVVSGGIEFESRLVNDYSPIARIFSGADFDIGEFTLDETREVLQKPVQGTSTVWSDRAIKKVQELSRGYPYLVQCLASASYLETGLIEDVLVENKLPEALALGKSWLNNELKDASDNDLLYFSRICELNKDTLKSSEMIELGISPPYIGRLVQHKIIEKINRGRYKLKKPPIIALYHSLKRELKHKKNLN